MSLHIDLTGCEHRDEGGKRHTFWVARCDCGWEGEERHGGSDHDLAKRDYRQHVEGALGADAYYQAGVGCRNCGSQHEQGVLVGTHVSSAPCVRCGTRMLQPRNETWDESREASRRWSW